jgi:hypothetical protein
MLEYRLDSGSAPKINNRDVIKFNMIWTARMSTLLEILIIGSKIQQYFAEHELKNQVKTEQDVKKVKDFFKKLKETDGKSQINGYSHIRMIKMNNIIDTILSNWKGMTTDVLNFNSKSKLPESSTITEEQAKSINGNLKEFLSNFNKGFYSPSTDSDDKSDDKFLSLPSVRILETELYNKIGYFIRLNTVIEQANAGILKTYTGNVPQINMDSLPELGFIEAFNVRNTEAVFRQIEIERQLMDSVQRSKNATIKFFPTFKIFLLPEYDSSSKA